MAIVEMWKRMAMPARAGLTAGVVLIAAMAIALGMWAYRTEYQVLFSEVAPADAAAMTAELDRLKTPYQLADGGNTILVPKDLVYKTRLQLMGKEMPLHGAVGFEVFNNADFGMTEFVQKVNYQRAIQGELTRTILSIEEIQAARVHLAIPEQGLFKKTEAKPKASVTLTMKQGRTLAGEQVAGIQRLVAASVPDIASRDVTVLNQHGVALTRSAQADGLETASTQLDSKRSTEEYLLKKVSQVLEQTYGAGEAVASIDVLLNLDQSKVTTEEVLPARNSDPAATAAGVLVRERQSARDGSDTGSAQLGSPKTGAGPASSSTELDYQVGRRVEQVVAASGTVKRMTIAVLVKQPMNEDQLAKLKEVVGHAVGVNAQRGDEVVVYSMAAVANGAAAGSAAAVAQLQRVVPDAVGPAAAPVAAASGPTTTVASVLSVLAMLAALGGVGYAAARRRRRGPARLDAAEREKMLGDIQRWIAASDGAKQGHRP